MHKFSATLWQTNVASLLICMGSNHFNEISESVIQGLGAIYMVSSTRDTLYTTGDNFIAGLYNTIAKT